MATVEEFVAWVNEAAMLAGVRVEKAERVKQDKPYPNDDIFMAHVVMALKDGYGSGCVWLHGKEIDNDQAVNMSKPMPAMETLKIRWQCMMREAWRNMVMPANPNSGGQ